MKIERIVFGGIEVYLNAGDCEVLAEGCAALGDRAATQGEEAAGRVEAMEAAFRLGAETGRLMERVPGGPGLVRNN